AHAMFPWGFAPTQEPPSQAQAQVPQTMLDASPHTMFPSRQYPQTHARQGAVSASPLAPPRVHGESVIRAFRFGEAVRMASTPESMVIAVTVPGSTPIVETIITASPFCRSPTEAFGIRPRKRCKSGGPLPRCHDALPVPSGFPVGGAGRCPPAGVCGLSSPPPLIRIAIRCAISGGSFLICESDD